MTHKTHLIQKQYDWFNLLSYPYYIFRFEGLWFGLLFFGNVYFLWKRQWDRIFPFALICCLMAVFTLTPDKGARYLCVAMPFMVMSVGSMIVFLYQEIKIPLQKNSMTLISNSLLSETHGNVPIRGTETL